MGSLAALEGGCSLVLSSKQYYNADFFLVSQDLWHHQIEGQKKTVQNAS